MKILQIIPHYLPASRFGGPQRVAHSLGKALTALDQKVVVCTTNLKDETSNLEVSVDVACEIDNLLVYYEPVPFFRHWGYSPQLKERIKQEIINSDIVLIHAHYQYANWIGALLARKFKKPYIIFAHGSLHKSGIGRKGILKKLYLRFLENANFTKSLYVVFNAPEEREQSYFAEHGRVVLSGVDLSEFSNLPPKDFFREKYDLGKRRILLFVGRLDVNQKGLDLLIPAFAGLVTKQPDIILVLAGPNEENGKDQILNLVEKWAVSDKVIMPGLLIGQEKLAAFQDADAFVLPSRFEGLSIALLEALYMGLPILTTDRVGLAGEIAQENLGFIVSPSISSIEQGLITLMEEHNLKEIRGKGRRLVLEKYNWNTIAKDFLTEIENFIKK